MLSQEIFRVFFTACVFGSILFFATIVGPTIMKILDGEEASVFLRRLIPRYYFFLIVAAGLGAFSSWEHEFQAFGLGLIAVSSIIISQLILPHLFDLRDLQMDGNADAGKHFVRIRRLVLVVTAVQLLIAAGVLARIAG